MKHHVTCEECGKDFEENGLRDLAREITNHFDMGDCEEVKKDNVRK